MTVDQGLANAQAYLYGKQGGPVDLTDKAVMTLDGVPLRYTPDDAYDDANAGSYTGTAQALPAGAAYAFELAYPSGIEMASLSLPMVDDAQILAPADGAVIQRGEDLVIHWSNADPSATDRIEFRSPGSSPDDYRASVGAAPGLAAVTVGTEELMYDLSGISSVNLVLVRTRNVTVGTPFSGGSASVTSDVARISVSVGE